MVSPSCVLGPIQATDLPAVACLYSEPKVRFFLGGPLARELAEQRAAELAQDSGQVWGVRPKQGPHPLLGIVMLDRHHDLEDIEISYVFLPEHWGRGYATEAVRQALGHAFGTMGLRRVVAETQAANAASVRLLERLGFQLLRQVVRFGAKQSIYLADPALIKAAT